MANKIKSDCETIRFQLEKFYKKANKIRRINTMSFPSIINKGHGQEIGMYIGKINQSNYCEKILSLIKEERFSMLLDDNSMITWLYSFDSDGVLKQHTLMFLPFCEDGDLNQMSKYFRIDFDEQGKAEFYHSLVHSHFSIFDNETRVPIDHVVYPTEFIYIILRYIYHDSSVDLEKIIEKSPKKAVLTKKEQKGFFLTFGEPL